MTLVEFLLARIAEDESIANAAIKDGEGAIDWAGESGPSDVHIARHDPARVLAECAVKRRIVEDHAPTEKSHGRWVYTDHDDEDGTRVSDEPACRQCTTSVQAWRVTANWDVAERVVAPCDTLRILASVYSDHLDYQQEWAPS